MYQVGRSAAACQATAISAENPVNNWVLTGRRGWDSNPRTLAGRRFSRPEPSTTRPPLQPLPGAEHLNRHPMFPCPRRAGFHSKAAGDPRGCTPRKESSGITQPWKRRGCWRAEQAGIAEMARHPDRATWPRHLQMARTPQRLADRSWCSDPSLVRGPPGTLPGCVRSLQRLRRCICQVTSVPTGLHSR